MERNEDLFTQVVHWGYFHSSDVRDRVYGLLSLKEPWDRESAIRPNYLISPFNLLLNMLVCMPTQSINPGGKLLGVGDAYQLAESLRIGSKIKEVVTALKHRHWDNTRGPGHLSGHLSKTQVPLQPSDQMYHVKIPMEGSVLLSRGVANNLYAPLVLGAKPCDKEGEHEQSAIDLVFERVRSASASSRRILYNQGLEIALLPHYAVPGDILLTHSNPSSDAIFGLVDSVHFLPCLLIRATDDSRLSAIVGQAICDPRMVLCVSADECGVCDVSPLSHYRKGGHYNRGGSYKDHSWMLYFDPEDLAVYLSQDRHHADVPGIMEREPVLDTSILPSEALNRLQTEVTMTPGSSFVFYNGTTEALATLHAAIASARESGKESEIVGTSQSKFGQTRRHSW